MTADGRLAPLSATQVLAALEVRVATGEVLRDRPVPLGFPTLDRAIGGGLRPGELLLLGGAQGTGKTTLALQMARNVAASGQATALYVCFEHDEEYLLHRLLAAETHLAGSGEPTAGVRLTDVRKEVAAAAGAAGTPGAVAASLVGNPRLAPAIERIAAYGPRLFLLRGSPADTVVAQLDALVRDYRAANPDGRLVLFLDYLQKVPVLPEPPGEAEKVTRIVNGL